MFSWKQVLVFVFHLSRILEDWIVTVGEDWKPCTRVLGHSGFQAPQEG